MFFETKKKNARIFKIKCYMEILQTMMMNNKINVTKSKDDAIKNVKKNVKLVYNNYIM